MGTYVDEAITINQRGYYNINSFLAPENLIISLLSFNKVYTFEAQQFQGWVDYKSFAVGYSYSINM